MALSARRVRLSDGEVFSALAAGDERAVERLVVDYLPRLTAFAESRGSTDPGGVANATLADFINRLDRLEFDDPARLRAYLYRSARSRIIDEYRASRPVELRDQSTLDAMAGGDGGHEDRIADRQYLDGLLSGLTAEQREILELRFGDDLSIQETAERTGRTATGVKAMQRRALRTLVAAMAGAACLLLIVWVVGRSGVPIATVSEDPASEPSVEVDRSDGRSSGPVEGIDDPGENVGREIGDDGGRDRTGLGDAAVIQVDESPSTGPTGSTVLSGSTGSATPTPTPTTPAVATPPSSSAPAMTSTSTTTLVTTSTTTSPSTTTTNSGAPGADGAPGAQGTLPTAAPLPTPGGEIHSCAGVTGTVAELAAEGWEVVVGTDGADIFHLSDRTGPVFVLGRGGPDVIITGSGDDVVCGGPGNDRLETGVGNDRASGNAGDDTLYGNDGVDTLDGGHGVDRCNLGEPSATPEPNPVACEHVVVGA